MSKLIEFVDEFRDLLVCVCLIRSQQFESEWSFKGVLIFVHMPFLHVRTNFWETGPTALFRWPSLCGRHPGDLQPSCYGVCDSRHGYDPNKHEIDFA
jgi:hypothetical protein